MLEKILSSNATKTENIPPQTTNIEDIVGQETYELLSAEIKEQLEKAYVAPTEEEKLELKFVAEEMATGSVDIVEVTERFRRERDGNEKEGFDIEADDKGNIYRNDTN